MRDEDKSREQLIGELKELRERLAGRNYPQSPAFMEERFREVLDELPVMIAFVNAERRFLFCNRTYRTRLGLRADNLVGKPLDEVLDPEIYLEVSDNVEKALAGEAVNFEMTSTASTDGTEHMFRFSFLPHADPNGEVGFFTLGTDITELKKVEEALRRSEAWFRTLAEHIPGISIQGYRTTGEVVYWNRQSEALFGYTAQEATGKNLLDLIVPEDMKPLFRLALDTGKGVEESGEFLPAGEVSLLHKQGHQVPIYAVHTAVYLEGSDPLLFCIGIDLADRKRIEEELLNAKKLEAIGILAGGIAHDFNNLLFVILGNISMAQMQMSREDPPFKRLSEAEKACLRAKDLTQKFITFSSGGGPLRNKVSIRELVENAVSLILSGSNIVSDISMPEDLWEADIDEDQMRQALTGIIANAKEAMPRGGALRVRAENLEVTPAAPVNRLKEGRHVKIFIEDEGIGIPEENLVKIFDPYFSTKYRGSQKGMGFGLAIAHSVIKRHNGQIKVESQLGRGTGISILIPASTARAVSSVLRPAPIPVGRKRVLVMDDEEMLGDLLKTMVEHLGFEAGLALNGEQVIEMYADAMEEGRDWDVLILDLTIKGGMGGKDTLQKLLYLNPDVKAVVSSGYSNDPIMSDYGRYGFKDILSKPYALEQLKRVLNRVLSDEGRVRPVNAGKGA
ncbi:MAG: PAS domain S-box protein [Syntrophobacteraceae bacterium]